VTGVPTRFNNVLLVCFQTLRTECELSARYSFRIHVWKQVMGLLDAQLAGASAETSGLSLRQYSITPLGNRVGLVQWVQNSVPLYSLFKQWQTRSVEVNPHC
jgi:hypothetical protein